MTSGLARRSARLLGEGAKLLPGLPVLVAFGHLARGGFKGLASLGWWEAAVVTLLLAGVLSAAWRRARREAVGAPSLLRNELELGGGLVAAAYVLVAVGGSPLYPIVYLLMAFLVSFLSRAAGLTLLGVALAFDAISSLPEGPSTFAAHAAFMVLFAVLYHVVLAARMAVARKAESEAVANRIREAEERARTFRLVSSGTSESQGGAKEEEKWLLASVKEVEGAVGSALEIAELALRTNTCAAFLLSADERLLKLHDCRSASDRVQRERFAAGEGILGGVLKRAVPVRMNAPTGLRGVTYYDGGAGSVCSLLAVPIVDGSGMVRGVLVADRIQDEPFSESDERLLATVASEVHRAAEVERVMGYIRKARDEKDRFFRAIEEMNRAGSPEQVFNAVLESARQVAALDFCAVTLVSEETGGRTHRIARISGVTSQGRSIEGRTFADNHGLVANVVRYGAPLPGRELRAMDRQVIFDADVQVRGLSALKIFPLAAAERILGTLVVGSRKRAAFDGDSLRMLEVIALQAAQAVLRAQLFEQMERMATTDGLTGLVNHRTFQTKAEEAMAQARRYGRKCSLILTDIDHFKSVNDTYGHPVGDLVLKGVSRVLREKARDTDVVARYGGEEFAIIMPETDAKGAQAIAERIREAVMAEVFQTEVGPLKVTLSLGIATCPEHAAEKQALIDLADQCLYQAKRRGRNQSVAAGQVGGRKLQVASG
ncbi:MAG: sensor domain-containing diguanylate cyclase [Myxococcales bacterium]|nr:sensor domain-containing diguanylate cyclase [Myxococcales bacterium]